MRLWDTAGTKLDAAILAFTTGEDPILDLEILPYDCLASAAHAIMLAEMGLLEGQERSALLAALGKAFRLAEAGKLPIRAEEEDGHTALEAFLVSETGEAGKKIHTGRSRNDQIIMAIRLMARERLLALATQTTRVVEALLGRGQEHALDVMPGYTHTRQAMPSSVGQLFFGAAEGLARDLESFLVPLNWANRSALGSASGYGVPLPLDRPRAAELLGLEEVDVNTIFAQNTRGRLEAALLFGLHQLSLTLGRLATDFINFSAEATGFFRLPEALTTGSSIMPQKRNPDVLELMRAVPAAMLARYTEVTALLHGLGAGYHRDLQRTKSPVLAGMAEMERVLLVMQSAVEELEVDRERARSALDDAIFATDRAYAHVQEGLSFREAYRRVKNEGPRAGGIENVLASREHLGAPGTDQRAALGETLARISTSLEPFSQGARLARSLLAESD